jgi:DNA segregation ATPase FtsK/SpoIIIE-like protein
MFIKKQVLFNKINQFCLTLFSLLSMYALLQFSANHNYLLYYDSAAVLQHSWLSIFLSQLALAWLYWLGGAAYIAVFSLVIYTVPKLLLKDWSYALDRFLGVLSIFFASNLLCQLYSIGNYANLPGGGRLGVFLFNFLALPFPVYLAAAYGLLLAGIILYTRLNFIWISSYVILLFDYCFADLWQKLMLRFYPEQQATFSNPLDLQKTVLEHEYQELLLDLEEQAPSDQFWSSYLTQSPLTQSPSLQADLDLNQVANLSLETNHTNSNPAKAFDPITKTELPTLQQAKKASAVEQKSSLEILELQANVLISKLKRFHILGQVTAIKPGPVITLFEFTPAEDAKISKIISLEHDLALALQTASLRIIAPVPGKAVVGFEVANSVRESVMLSDVLQDARLVSFIDKIKSGQFDQLAFQIPMAIGKDTIGDNVIIDLVRSPHLLVAGSTGSGKSVALNSILVSMLCANPPERLRLILIDPKRLEFARYANIGHLLFPIVSDAKTTLITLRWVIQEMERRYQQMAKVGVRNMADYNQYLNKQGLAEFLPYIVIVIDELADLMMTAGRDVEDLIIRIAQMARAAGIHMIVATQRPSVDVVTGLIKVNFPSRISFRVATKADSRTILDTNGADTLLGAGDMLILDAQSAILKRAHGAYVTDTQVQDVVQFILNHYPTNYLNLNEMQFSTAFENEFDQDDLLDDVISFLKECEEVSISLLQRRFRIGYNRSAKIMDILQAQGYVLTSEHSKLRKVLKDRLG